MLCKFCAKLVQDNSQNIFQQGIMRCKFCIKLVQIPQKIFSMMFVVYSFQALKLGLARLYCDFLEMRSVASNHAGNGCIFLNHLNKYGIFLTVLDAWIFSLDISLNGLFWQTENSFKRHDIYHVNLR